MSQSFTILRDQLNRCADFMRPSTLNVIRRAISAMESSSEEITVLPMNSLIITLRSGRLSDFQAITEFLDNPLCGDSVCCPIFDELIAEHFLGIHGQEY